MTETEQPSVKAATEYVVLKLDLAARDGQLAVWVQVESFEARNGEHAIRRYIERTKVETGTFVAIPARSWQPVKVAVKTETKVEVSAT